MASFGEFVGQCVFATRDMSDLPCVETVQKVPDYYHEWLQSWILNAIDSLDLADEKLRVEIDGNVCGPSPQGLSEAEDEGLVLGDIVGTVAEEFLRRSDRLAIPAHEDGTRSAFAWVSPAGAIGEKEQVLSAIGTLSPSR